MTNLGALSGRKWAGKGELWLDETGNDAEVCDCTLGVVDGRLVYTWSYQGKPQEGSLTPVDGGFELKDTWHSPTAMRCEGVAGTWALLDGRGTYPAGDGPDWGWRVTLAHRPSGELVLQMTNIKPWGEEGRAVRMIGATRS